MKRRVACKGIPVEVSTKMCVTIHRWELNINVRVDLLRKTDLLLMSLANVLWEISVRLTWGCGSRHWNWNSCCTKQWWGDLWDRVLPPHPWKTEELYVDVTSFILYFYVPCPVNGEVDYSIMNERKATENHKTLYISS